MNLWFIMFLVIVCSYVLMCIVAIVKNDPVFVNDENPYLNSSAISVLPEDMRRFVKRMPENPGRKAGLYEKIWKRVIDSMLSFLGLMILSPVFLVVVIWIKIDDPGPAFFTQKRVGKGKAFFCLHKFRTMKISTPHDIPTHMLKNPEQYITKAGKFLRKSSLDELPQIWDIFRGKISVIGPRPALWNQADLIAEREKNGANDIMPGLTGWAQINGRDELEIIDKAKLDGDYCKKVCLRTDIKCFFGTIKSVVKSDGVVEGGTGETHKHGVIVPNDEKTNFF